MLLVTVSAAKGADGVDLRIALDPASHVTLGWTGGQPLFKVFRHTSPRNLSDPSNLIGETLERAWMDSPPGAEILFYLVTSPCVVHPPECRDGVDNDCDGLIDEVEPEACSNGIDDDCDRLIDADDPDCGCPVCECCSDECGPGYLCGFSGCCISHCFDGIRNGTESDVDCGFYCPTQCPPGAHCFIHADCASGVCDATDRCQ